MATQLPQLDHASLTDVGRKRLANEDAYHCEPQMGLFVVCDGIGGQPSGEAASQIVSHTLGHLIRRRLRQLDAIDEPILRKILTEVPAEISIHLHKHAEKIPALTGMCATMVAALFDSQSVYVVHVGDSRAYLLRRGDLQQLTQDQSKQYRQYKDEKELTTQEVEQRERRLLTQYVGTDKPRKSHVERVMLEPGDRLLLCSDGLTDPLSDDAIAGLLRDHASSTEACRLLIDAANAGGGPDNITAVIVDYEGVRELGTEELRAEVKPAAVGTKHGVARRFHAALVQMNNALTWLREGARECADLPVVSAFAAVKRRLGADVYRSFLEMHPSQNPSHVFHRAATSPDSTWRKSYEQHLSELGPIVAEITSGSVRLSPILTSEETALIIRVLWHDWRRVEQRYFRACQRDAISETEQTLNILIDHMLHSVHTLIGLLEFFPKFMRLEPKPAPKKPPASADKPA